MTLFVEIAFNIPLNKLFTYKITDELITDTSAFYKNREKNIGKRIEALFNRKKKGGWIVNIYDKPQDSYPVDKILNIDRIIDDESLADIETINLAKWIANFYICSLGEVLSIMLPGGKREKELSSMGMSDEEGQIKILSMELSQSQKNAIDQITQKKDGKYYLYGVTGSGKTEVFLQSAERTIAEGRSVIYLVPEISLTHQLVDSVKNRFSECGIALLHSHLTPSQKLKEWKRIINGEASIVLGARSAIFAPMKKIGLVIIDEEHETSFKSGSNPRYHARQIAMKRVLDSKARLVMGSATPSLESWNAMTNGDIVRLDMKERVSGGSLPLIKIIDMKRSNGIFSNQLINEIDHTLEEKRQIILFLNRRGHSYFFHCKSCGYEQKCRQCSVSLTYHRDHNSLICHYCGYQERPAEVCPECNSLDVGYSGFGTQQIEDETTKLFPKARVVRLDTDVAKKKGVAKRILSDFKNGDFDILLGTQMVAKGLNFPKVDLVGVILADTSLNLPDFRASEKTFGLITQVSGRAGRYSKNGRVVVQTFKPSSDSIIKAANYEPDLFYNEEMKIRKMINFPPYSRLVRLLTRSKNQTLAKKWMKEISSYIETFLRKDNQILGPVEAPLSQVSGNWRYHLIIQTNKFTEVHTVINHMKNQIKLPPNVYLEVDFDPVSLL